jgi:PPOX class probable F420-dependent enzyme
VSGIDGRYRPRVDHDDLRARFGAARVARLATVDDRDRPHIVPVCFVLRDDTILSVVDDKPKTTTSLRRLDNVRAHPAVSALVDEYDDDWTRLWWVRADGTARVVTTEHDPVDHDAAVDLLAAKYAPYRERRPRGPVLAIAVERWRGWSWREGGSTR